MKTRRYIETHRGIEYLINQNIMSEERSRQLYGFTHHVNMFAGLCGYSIEYREDEDKAYMSIIDALGSNCEIDEIDITDIKSNIDALTAFIGWFFIHQESYKNTTAYKIIKNEIIDELDREKGIAKLRKLELECYLKGATLDTYPYTAQIYMENSREYIEIMDKLTGSDTLYRSMGLIDITGAAGSEDIVKAFNDKWRRK